MQERGATRKDRVRYSTQLGGSGWEHPGAGAIRAQLLSRHMSAVENSRGDGQGRGEVITMESATEGKGVMGAVTEGRKHGG